MAITRTATATANSKILGTTLAFAVTAAAGSSLIVSIVDDGTNALQSISWNGATFTQDVSAADVTNAEFTYIWSAHNVPAGTAVTMTLTWPGTGVTAKACTVSEVSGWPNKGVLDLQTSAIGGSNTAPASGATGLTTDANEYWAGAIGDKGPSTDTAPTWLNSFSAGQRSGTTGGGATTNRTVNEGFRVVTTTGGANAAATLGTARFWGACVATYKNFIAAAPIFEDDSFGTCKPWVRDDLVTVW